MTVQREQTLPAVSGKPSSDSRTKDGKPRGPHRQLGPKLVPYLFLLPFLLLFISFLILPLVYALGISMFEDRLVGGSVFIGAENYLRAFRDQAFLDGVGRMLLFGVVQVPIMLALALTFALILESGLVRFRKFFRLAIFLPYAIPSVVAALTWGYLYGPTFGPFTQAAEFLNITPPRFLSEAGMLPSLGNIVTWEFTGYNMIILYAALQAVPPELREASSVDGATGWQIARYIKIPLIAPALVFTTVFSIIGTLQLFNEPSIMGAIAPTVIQNDYTPNLYAYNLAFQNQQYNFSAAISFALGFIVFVGSFTFMTAMNRRNAT